jgi:hypothetical protein
VVGHLWENILDPQRFAILKEKGAVEEVVRSFGENLRNDIFALESQVRWGSGLGCNPAQKRKLIIF